MSTTKTIELPLGNGTAKCTIEIPDASHDPPAPEAVVDFTYQAVAWIVKLAAEINTTAPASPPPRSSIRQVRDTNQPSTHHHSSSTQPDEAAIQLIGVKRERQPDCVHVGDGSPDRGPEAGTVVKRPKLALRHDSFWKPSPVAEIPIESATLATKVAWSTIEVTLMSNAGVLKAKAAVERMEESVWDKSCTTGWKHGTCSRPVIPWAVQQWPTHDSGSWQHQMQRIGDWEALPTTAKTRELQKTPDVPKCVTEWHGIVLRMQLRLVCCKRNTKGDPTPQASARLGFLGALNFTAGFKEARLPTWNSRPSEQYGDNFVVKLWDPNDLSLWALGSKPVPFDLSAVSCIQTDTIPYVSGSLDTTYPMLQTRLFATCDYIPLVDKCSFSHISTAIVATPSGKRSPTMSRSSSAVPSPSSLFLASGLPRNPASAAHELLVQDDHTHLLNTMARWTGPLPEDATSKPAAQEQLPCTTSSIREIVRHHAPKPDAIDFTVESSSTPHHEELEESEEAEIRPATHDLISEACVSSAYSPDTNICCSSSEISSFQPHERETAVAHIINKEGDFIENESPVNNDADAAVELLNSPQFPQLASAPYAVALIAAATTPQRQTSIPFPHGINQKRLSRHHDLGAGLNWNEVLLRSRSDCDLVFLTQRRGRSTLLDLDEMRMMMTMTTKEEEKDVQKGTGEIENRGKESWRKEGSMEELDLLWPPPMGQNIPSKDEIIYLRTS
ncbi:hypothetical protein CERZMDRAFT_99928 [Cercospora zeae-maydis SCOH1-5]|uniref:Uncharacterized protein n=1 Tax=Cercospora zeae-maydis SCOH1-5 TaxID=717836 RepID=A0A6A6F900_9PEZI|nr:hypothetical protein CERZMDRAFT_99928 [Cercospora zeae-maydis SCOH1-5]